MAAAQILVFGFYFAADFLRHITPRMKYAARRRIGGTRQIAFENDFFFFAFFDNGNGGQERFRIGVRRIFVDVFLRRRFDDVSQIHDDDAVGNVFDDAEVVRNKDIRDPHFFLQFLQQVYNLRLDGNVERRNRLVADDHFRPKNDGARDADALPLSAGKFVRIAIVVFCV